MKKKSFWSAFEGMSWLFSDFIWVIKVAERGTVMTGVHEVMTYDNDFSSYIILTKLSSKRKRCVLSINDTWQSESKKKIGDIFIRGVHHFYVQSPEIWWNHKDVWKNVKCHISLISISQSPESATSSCLLQI